MEIKGKVLQSLPLEGGTSKAGKEWKKASLIVEVAENPQYPKKIKISNMKNADAFSKLAVGTEATFKVEIESHEFNGRWFTSVNCWKWDVGQYAATQQPAPEPAQQVWQAAYPQLQPKVQVAAAPQQADDLPF